MLTAHQQTSYRRAYEEIFQVLVQQPMIAVSLHAFDKTKQTPFHYAVKARLNQQFFAMMIEPVKSTIDLTMPINAEGQTLLHYLITTWDSDLTIIQTLFEHRPRYVFQCLETLKGQHVADNKFLYIQTQLLWDKSPLAAFPNPTQLEDVKKHGLLKVLLSANDPRALDIIRFNISSNPQITYQVLVNSGVLNLAIKYGHFLAVKKILTALPTLDLEKEGILDQVNNQQYSHPEVQQFVNELHATRLSSTPVEDSGGITHNIVLPTHVATAPSLKRKGTDAS